MCAVAREIPKTGTSNFHVVSWLFSCDWNVTSIWIFFANEHSWPILEKVRGRSSKTATQHFRYLTFQCVRDREKKRNLASKLLYYFFSAILVEIEPSTKSEEICAMNTQQFRLIMLRLKLYYWEMERERVTHFRCNLSTRAHTYSRSASISVYDLVWPGRNNVMRPQVRFQIQFDNQL